MTHPVIDVLQRRHAGSAQIPNAKVGLVVQGGGMRCVTSAGIVLALEDAGMFPHIDAFYGSSAGAIVAAYFASRQSHVGASILVDDLSSPDFIDVKRMLRRRGPIMSLDHLCRDVVASRKPLDVATLRKTSFEVLATSATTGQAVRLTPFISDDEVVQALRATCSLPLVCGAPVQYRDDTYFDGGIHESIPFRAAIEDGCTHILVAASTPWGAERRSTAMLGHRVLALLMRRKHPVVANELVGRVDKYLDDLAYLRNKTERPGTTGPFIYTVTPEGNLMGPLERRRQHLQTGIDNGYTAMQLSLLTDIDLRRNAKARLR